MSTMLSHEQLIAFSAPWYWMVSDRVGEFDDFLMRPMKNLTLIRAETEIFLRGKKRIDPNGSDKQVSNLVGQMLQNLEHGGEDAMRIFEWGRALDKNIIPVVLGYEKKPDGSIAPILNEFYYKQRVLGPWMQTLMWWKPDSLSALNRSCPDLRDALYASWYEEVLEPSKVFRERYKADKKTWMTSPDRRTDWDNYLWEEWFQEFHHDPAMIAYDGYKEMRTREWWREISPTISREQKQQLMNWHGEMAHSLDKDSFLNSDQMGWLDDGLLIDVIPPFYSSAAKQRPDA